MSLGASSWSGGCPRCANALALDGDDVRGGRARCGSCGTGSDVVVARAQGEGPLRSYDLIRLEPDPHAPPPCMEDLSGRGRTRHVRISAMEVARPFSGWWSILRAFLHLGAVFLLLAAVAEALSPPRGPVLVVAALLAAFEVYVVNRDRLREVARRALTEEIVIEDRHLVRRRVVMGLPRTLRVPISEVEHLSLITGRRDGVFVRARLSSGRSIPLARGFAQGESSLSWLRDHLQRGIDHARG